MVFLDRFLEADAACNVVNDEPFGVHEAWGSDATVFLQFGDETFHIESIHRAGIQRGNNRAARGQILKIPARGIEQAELLFGKSVATLDACAPPFTKMTTYAELQKLFTVLVRPRGKPIVVILGGDPASAACRKELARFGNHDLCVRAVDLLRDNHIP